MIVLVSGVFASTISGVYVFALLTAQRLMSKSLITTEVQYTLFNQRLVGLINFWSS